MRSTTRNGDIAARALAILRIWVGLWFAKAIVK